LTTSSEAPPWRKSAAPAIVAPYSAASRSATENASRFWIGVNRLPVNASTLYSPRKGRIADWALSACSTVPSGRVAWAPPMVTVKSSPVASSASATEPNWVVRSPPMTFQGALRDSPE
jgi:hypothetical protein